MRRLVHVLSSAKGREFESRSPRGNLVNHCSGTKMSEENKQKIKIIKIEIIIFFSHFYSHPLWSGMLASSFWHLHDHLHRRQPRRLHCHHNFRKSFGLNLN